MKHYTFIDYATQAYLALVGLLMLLFHNEAVPEWPFLLFGHAICVGLVHLLIRSQAVRTPGTVLDFLRHFYPVLLYAAFYRETGALNRMFLPDYLDPLLIRLEERLFGLQPSLAFMERLPCLTLSEILYAAYFSYYLMIVGVGLALYLRDRRQFFHYVSVVSFVFYVCYVIYIFLPVMGPRVFFREFEEYRLPEDVQPAVAPIFPEAIRSGPFYQVMAIIYRYFEAPGAAFPSSHVAVALCTLYFSTRYLRPIRHLHGVMVILLCLSTIYCRYHYVLDVLAGILTAAALLPLGNSLYSRFGGLAHGSGSDVGVGAGGQPKSERLA